MKCKLSSHQLLTLQPGNWLSGDVVNGFLERLLTQYSSASCSSFHVFSSYLYTDIKTKLKRHSLIRDSRPNGASNVIIPNQRRLTLGFDGMLPCFVYSGVLRFFNDNKYFCFRTCTWINGGLGNHTVTSLIVRNGCCLLQMIFLISEMRATVVFMLV